MEHFEDYLCEDDALVRLAKAVITQACKDYLANGRRGSSDAAFKKFCTESIWIDLFNIDGMYIFEQMKRRKEERFNGKRTKRPRQTKGEYKRTVKKVDSEGTKTVDQGEDRGSK